MKHKILSTIVALLLVVALLPMSVLAASYTDTDGHWAESSIERWSDAGVVQGTGDAFAPDSDLTCAQLATILAKLLRLPAADDAGFSDNLADAWYYDAINRCAAAGILTGYADGTVRPNETISRARAMVMLARALGIEPAGTSVLNGYADSASVPDYARGYVAALIRADIVGGVSGSRLAALANITRAQFVTILDRAIAIYADEDGATVKADDVDGIIVVVAEDVKIKDARAVAPCGEPAAAAVGGLFARGVFAGGGDILPLYARAPAGVGGADGGRPFAGVVLRVSGAYARAAHALPHGADHRHLPPAAVRPAARRAVRHRELRDLAHPVPHPVGAAVAHLNCKNCKKSRPVRVWTGRFFMRSVPRSGRAFGRGAHGTRSARGRRGRTRSEYPRHTPSAPRPAPSRTPCRSRREDRRKPCRPRSGRAAPPPAPRSERRPARSAFC